MSRATARKDGIMKRNALLCALLLTAGCAGLKPYPYEQRPLAAVMPFAYSAQPQEYIKSVGGLPDALAGALVRTERVRLVERQRLESLAAEQKLSLSGAVDTNTAVKLGQMLGAQMVVLGAVTSVSVREEGRSVKFAEKTDRWVEVEVEARLVDIETGELLAAGRAIGKTSSAEKHAFGGTIGELASKESLVQQAVQGMGEKLAADLAKGIRPKKK